jgi:hypothetical protein
METSWCGLTDVANTTHWFKTAVIPAAALCCYGNVTNLVSQVPVYLSI